MLQYNPSITGSLQVTGSISVTGNIIASGSIIISGSVASASYAEFLGGLPSSSFASASVFNTVSSSYAAASASLSTRVTTLESASGSFAAQSASLSTRVTNLEATSSTVSSSFASTSGSIAGRVTCIEGQYATTGSNNFSGRQYVSDVSNAIGFASTASLYTDGGLRVTKDSFVSGTAYFNNVVVYGTSSIEYITSSQLAIGTNIITLNTDTPSIRYGGISVFDSGSNNQSTGSLFWDSEKDKWIYSNPSGSTYDGGMLISGPRNSSGLGNEVGTTSCAVMIGQGGDHITSSGIFSYGNATCFYGNSYISSTGAMCIGGSLTGTSATFTGSLNVTGSNSILNVGCVGIGIENPVTKLHVNGNIISEGCFFSGAPDNLRIFAGYWSTVSGNGNCYLVLQAGGGNASFGTPSGWGGTASIYTCGQTRLSISTNGIACFACQVCAPMVLASGCIGINTNAPDSLLHVLNCSNTPYNDVNILASGQWSRTSNPSTCTGATSGIIFVAQGPSGGNGLATINGVTTSCGSMAITFGTRNASGNVTERMRIASGGTVLVGTTNADIGGSVIGVGFTQNGRVLASICESGALCNIFMGDRRCNEGPVFMMMRGGYFKAAIGVLGTASTPNDGGITFSTICGNDTITERIRINSTGVLGFNGNSSPGNAGLDKMSMGYLNGGYGWIQTWNGTPLVLNREGNNVGIGTSAPGSLLHTSGTSNIFKHFTTANNGTWIEFQANSTNVVRPFYVGQDNSAGGSFGVGGYAGVIFTSSGDPVVLATASTARLTVAGNGIACFACQVCAPRFVGPVTGNLNGFPTLAQVSCTLGGASNDVTVYFTSNISIAYGVNDYTVFVWAVGNSAVNSSLRALIPYNYYQSTTTTTNLASYLDSPNGHTALAVAVCKLVNSNTYCIAVRFAVSSGGVGGYAVQVTKNGIQTGFD